MKWLQAWLLSQSCKLGNSILDWIRSIYFSLLGSSVLNFSLKLFSFDVAAVIVYAFGIAFFLVGLLYSVRITKRFKSYEKSWPINVPDPNSMHLDDYCKEQEGGERFALQHTLLYTLWLPALLCIGVVSFRTELRAKPTNQDKKEISRLESESEELKAINTELLRIEAKIDDVSNATKEHADSSKDLRNERKLPTKKSTSP
jgi:hypothetical protein